MLFNPIVFYIGLFFSPFAALMAYIITYGEYQHHYPDKTMPRRLALEAGIGTFVFFLLISIFIGWFMGATIK